MSKKLMLVIIIALFGATFATYLSGDYESLANQIWNLVPPLLASICGIMAVKVYGMDNPHAKAIAFLALGIFFWFLGDSIWFILEYFLNKSPFPSVADYFYLLAYPLLLTGLSVEIKNNQLNWSAGKISFGVLLSIIVGAIVLYFGVVQAYSPAESLLNNAIAISYGIGDLVLIIFAIVILMVAVGYHKGKLFYPWLYILIGFFLILAADILFAIYREEYENFTGLIRNIDLGWISGFLFISYGFFSIGDTVKNAQSKLLKGNK